jgi:tetratricopeptide (TPR) repeat protein
MAGMLILVATVVAYLPALSGKFIWNDSDYVTAPALRSVDGLARIWTEPGAVEQYYPILHSAFWVQHRVFGDNPFGYHLVTVLLHAGAALLFGLIVHRLLEKDAGLETAPSLRGQFSGFRSQVSGFGFPAGFLAALLFALHPVHVESVAWISEQKNTLSLIFYLAAALAYLRFDETRRPGAYVAAVVLFVISLGCKTVTATLPAALWVVLWWKRGRLEWRRDGWPLMPWLVLGIVAGLFSSWVEQTYLGAKGEDFDLPALARVLVAGRAIWFYAGKLVWPADLNFIYPRWTVDATVGWQWLFPLGVLATGAALWALRRRTRGPLAAFLLFTGSLFPVLGFVNLYGARYSWVWDHWQYLPDLGLIALAAAGLAAGGRLMGPGFRWLGRGLVAALAVLLGALTWSHCGMFRDDETLYLTTIARNPGAWMAHHNLGRLRSLQPGRMDDAIVHYQASLRLNPDNADAHNNLGLAWATVPGKMNDAQAAFEEALRLNPNHAGAHNNLGNVYAQTAGRLEDAAVQFQEALRLDPAYAAAHYNLGNIRAQSSGRGNEAIAAYEATLRLDPNHAGAHNNLGNVLSEMPGRLGEAIAHYEAALRLQPDYESAWYNLAVCRFDAGNLPGAAVAFREVLRLSPGNVAAQRGLAAAMQGGGR